MPISAWSFLLVACATTELFPASLPAFGLFLLVRRTKLPMRQNDIKLVDLDPILHRLCLQIVCGLHFIDLPAHRGFERTPLPRFEAS